MGTEMGGLWLARDRPLESPADASQQIKVKVSWQNFPDTELHTMGIYTISSVPSITPGIWCMCVWNVYERVCVNMLGGNIHMCRGQRYFYQWLFTLLFEIESSLTLELTSLARLAGQ